MGNVRQDQNPGQGTYSRTRMGREAQTNRPQGEGRRRSRPERGRAPAREARCWVRGCRAQGRKYPPWGIPQDSQGYRRWTLTTQLFTREPDRVLWPRAALRLLQGTRQPVLWPGATLRLFTHFYKANHDNPSQPRQPKITRVLLPIWGYFRRRKSRTSSPARTRIEATVPRVGRRCRPRG